MKTIIHTTKQTGLGLILLFFIVYLLPLGARQLSVPDEMRYAEIAREMLHSGQFVSPHLNGLRYFEKPAAGHMLNAASLFIFGQTNFAVRFASALATGISALGLFFLMKKKSDQQTAGLSALIFLTTALVMGVGTFSILDGVFSCFVTLTIATFYLALESENRQKIGLLALAGAFAGGAFLIKGFLAFALPVVVIVPYLLIRKEWKALFLLPWIPLATALLVALPWSLAIAKQEPDFWRYFFWEEHIRRFFSGEHAQHAKPFWYFIPVFLLGAFPWILVAPTSLRDLFRTRIQEPLVLFSLCWLLAPLLFFSASSGKLGTYILPCFAPFAILMALGLNDQFKLPSPHRAFRVGITIFSYILMLLLIALPIIGGLEAFRLIPSLDPHFFPKFLFTFMGVALAFTLSRCAICDDSSLRGTIWVALSSATLFILVQTCAPTNISTSLGIQHFLKTEQAHIDDRTILVTDPRTVHAACYVYKRDDLYLFRRKSELEYGLSYPDSTNRFLNNAQLLALLRERGNQRVALIIKSKPDDRHRADLPAPTYQAQWLKIWFAVYEPLTPENKE